MISKRTYFHLNDWNVKKVKDFMMSIWNIYNPFWVIETGESWLMDLASNSTCNGKGHLHYNTTKQLCRDEGYRVLRIILM
ncbi:Uncharacterized protein TCM_026490 [Theobroma cacao]|uniref:Uncharacterized protein n=1 Tax=Theobroma cacao TaxID=3641 RepID=A0A061F2I1_THECC|nr:Uncharacterized protein TCM_026490 [Theobroma cacao]